MDDVAYSKTLWSKKVHNVMKILNVRLNVRVQVFD